MAALTTIVLRHNGPELPKFIKRNRSWSSVGPCNRVWLRQAQRRPKMKNSLILSGFLFVGSGLACCGSETGAAPLPRSTPETQGISSKAVLGFIDAVDQIDAMNSFMLVRHGQVIAEGWWTPYDAESKHELYSLSKSFTSTAAGLAIAEGKLSIDDEVMKFFPDDAQAEPGNNL